MFNKIMKRGGRKTTSTVPKPSSDPIDAIPLRATPDPIIPPTNPTTTTTTTATTTTTTTGNPPIWSTPDLHFLLEHHLPSFRDVPSHERPNLFLRKLQICSVALDMSDTLRHPREKETKRHTLLELVDYMQAQAQSNEPLPDPLQEHLLHMVSSNIFRSLPASPCEVAAVVVNLNGNGNGNGTSISISISNDPLLLLLLQDPEEEDPYYDPSWPHLQIVYELLLRYVVSPETTTKSAKRFLDHSFVLRLLDLFASEDAREREYLKTILHRIYGKFMLYRPFIRGAVANVFHRFVFETQRHAGIAELLEILGSIVAGFALPMKEEHRLFLSRTLMPLHRPKYIGMYHQQLTYCVTQFLEKDPKLATTVLRGLLRYWPLTNCQKEVLFLAELEELLELTHSVEFQACMVPLFRQIARCLNSPHFQVAERALFLWNNDHVVSLIAQNRSVIFPIIFDALEKNLQGHWNQAVHGLTSNVRKMFLEMDNELFEECQRQHAEEAANAKASEEERELKWKRLEEAAAARVMEEDMAVVNY